MQTTPTEANATRKRLPVVTNSELGTFRRCAREHHYAYRLGYRPRERDDDALNFGSLMHAALEAWWRAHVEAPRERLDAAFAAIDVHVDKDDHDASIVRARAEALMVGYESRWAGVESFDVLGVELEFRAPLINPVTGGVSRTFELAGKLDALVSSRDDGNIYIVEHKTSAEDISAGSVYWQRLRLDSQISTYFAGARSLGYVPRGCLYDVIGKPKLQPFKATPVEDRKYTKKEGKLYANQREADETVDEYYDRVLAAITAEPERYYQRGPVVRLPTEESDAAFDAWQTARAIRDAELANCAPRNVASCERYHRLCSYFDVCTSSASLNDTARFERVDNVHPELSLATVSTAAV